MVASPLFENEHVTVSVLRGERIVLVVRKPSRLELHELDRAWGAADRALAAVDRMTHCLIVDVSGTPGRNDEEFERAFTPFRQSLSLDWLEMALVVASMPGRLQVARYAREDGARVSTFESRDMALALMRRRLGTER